MRVQSEKIKNDDQFDPGLTSYNEISDMINSSGLTSFATQVPGAQPGAHAVAVL